ncbi:DUF397 domain-containing protein [Streptomyces sp. PmtG]
MSPSEHVLPDSSVLRAWRRSTHSGPNEGSCLEVSDACPRARGARPRDPVPVRDSKDPRGPALVFAAPAWEAFVGAVRGGCL